MTTLAQIAFNHVPQEQLSMVHEMFPYQYDTIWNPDRVYKCATSNSQLNYKKMMCAVPTDLNYDLICGQVQSGKTNEILSYCWVVNYVYNKSVILLLRNYRADVNQILSRISTFNKVYWSSFSLSKPL